jgi:hypothetical protein
MRRLGEPGQNFSTSAHPMPLPIIGKLLGHERASTTQRYAHLDTDLLRRASDHIGVRLAAALGEANPEPIEAAVVVPMRAAKP